MLEAEGIKLKGQRPVINIGSRLFVQFVAEYLLKQAGNQERRQHYANKARFSKLDFIIEIQALKLMI